MPTSIPFTVAAARCAAPENDTMASRAVLQTFERYQKERVAFVSAVAEMAKSPQVRAASWLQGQIKQAEACFCGSKGLPENTKNTHLIYCLMFAAEHRGPAAGRSDGAAAAPAAGQRCQVSCGCDVLVACCLVHIHF